MFTLKEYLFSAHSSLQAMLIPPGFLKYARNITGLS